MIATPPKALLALPIDDRSRLAYTQLLPTERKEDPAAFLNSGLAWFSSHGVVVERVMTDNGSAYKSRLGADWLASAHGARHRRDSVYLLGAICPERAVGAAIILPVVSIEEMNLHLEEISSQVAPRAVAAVICDGAGWHLTGRELTVPDNIVLVTLPPYSPELNPMENVRQYLRE